MLNKAGNRSSTEHKYKWSGRESSEKHNHLHGSLSGSTSNEFSCLETNKNSTATNFNGSDVTESERVEGRASRARSEWQQSGEGHEETKS